MKEIFIYDMIGSMGVDSMSIIEQLEGKEEVNVRINSVGGDVFEGIAIYNALKKHEGKVNVTIEGIAASMASVIMLAGDHIDASENSLIMIHNPSVGIQGESKDLTSKAELLDKIKEQMLAVYGEKTGKDADEISAMMDKETWLTATEAQEIGLVDSVSDKVEVAAHFDISNFNSPEWVKEKYNNNNNNETEITMKKLHEMLESLKASVTKFKEEKTVDVNIIDDESIKNQIVDFTQELNVAKEENESIVNGVTELKGMIITYEETIKAQEEKVAELESEISKTNATPTTEEVEPIADPVVTEETTMEKSAFDGIADMLKGDSAFQFTKDNK